MRRRIYAVRSIVPYDTSACVIFSLTIQSQNVFNCTFVLGEVWFHRYRSDSSLPRDDHLGPTPSKQRRTATERDYWESPSGTSYPGLHQNVPIGSSPSPSFGHLDLTPQSSHTRPHIYYPPITRADGSQMSLYMGLEQYPPNTIDNYYMNNFGRCSFDMKLIY